jgi:hypothetical protein
MSVNAARNGAAWRLRAYLCGTRRVYVAAEVLWKLPSEQTTIEQLARSFRRAAAMSLCERRSATRIYKYRRG